MKAFVLAVSFFALAGMLTASRARAEAGPVLHLSSPEGEPDPSCLSLDELARNVERTLGRPALRTSPGSFDGTLEIAVSQRVRNGGWAARLAVRDGGGSFVGAREILRASPSCHALDSAVVLVAALLVDTLRAREPQATATQAAPSARAARSDAAQREAAIQLDAEPAAALAASPPSARPSYTLDNGLGAVITAGAMPHAALGVAGFARFSTGRWFAAELAGAWLPHTALNDHPGATFDGGWLTVGYCPTLVASGRNTVIGCARGGVAFTRATGRNVAVSESSTLPYGLLGLAVRGRVTLVGPLSASLELGGYAPLDRPEFFVRSGTTRSDLFSASGVFGAVSAFLEIRGL